MAPSVAANAFRTWLGAGICPMGCIIPFGIAPFGCAPYGVVP
jgi:hypothetical protein